MASHNQKGRSKRSSRRFIQLWTNVKRSRAYHGLSAYGRSALFEILDRYTGINNGMIQLGVRELADELNCSTGSAWNALRELEDARLIEPSQLGTWRGKRATEWRVMFYRCDRNHDLPVTSWPARDPFSRVNTKSTGLNTKTSPVHGDEQNHEKTQSDRHRTVHGAEHYIDIRQSESDRDKAKRRRRV